MTQFISSPTEANLCITWAVLSIGHWKAQECGDRIQEK